MNSRTLVVVLGQLRAHRLTWANFKQNVLDPLNADLAVCVVADNFFDFTNPFYMNARFRWLVPYAADLADTFDRIQGLLGSSEDWRVLCDVQFAWLGGVAQSNQPGAGAVTLALRWFMLNNIRAAGLTDVYDRFVITRADYYYARPHPPMECLSADNLWIPDGEDGGGLCDRHLVASASNLIASCNLLDDFLLDPQGLRDAMIGETNWNTERILGFHLSRNGLLPTVRRFPFVMFLVRDAADPVTWGPGVYLDDIDMVVKQPHEFQEASRFYDLLDSKQAWQLYFAAQYFADRLPARVYTIHGTVVYADDTTGELRHGPLADAPANVFLVIENAAAFLIHKTRGSNFGVRFLSGSGSSILESEGRDPASVATLFERVPVASEKTSHLIGLRSGGLYLSAVPDGQLVLDKPHCEDWEYFRPITYSKAIAPSEAG